MRFKIDRASLIVGSKFTVFALFYFVFGGNFPSTSTRGAYIWRGDLTERFLCYRFGGLTFGGAYTWRGLFFGILRYFLNSIARNRNKLLTHIYHCSGVVGPKGLVQ